MLIYLGSSALTAFLVSGVLSILDALSPLATAHLVLAVAIMPLIFGAITHFMPVLTRSGGPHRAVWLIPLLLQVAGVLVFLYFQGAAGMGALHAAASLSLLSCIGLSAWLVRRARRTLGKPHPGWRWYLAAIACLGAGLALVPVMSVWPELWPSLRLLHLHLNTLGFVGLTAIGTLQVLMPTILSGPDAEASVRLQQDLPPAVVGVGLIAIGAAFWWPLSILGTLSLGYVVVRLGSAWLRRYGLRMIVNSGAAASLAAALIGFLMLLLFGVLHGLGWLSGRDAVPAFVAGFLMPLVTGALSQLLPVWCIPGRRTAMRDRLHQILGFGGAVRSLVFLAGGVLLAFGQNTGFWLVAAGLLSFVALVLRALAVLLFSNSATDKFS
jgi:hypothetical protein